MDLKDARDEISKIDMQLIELIKKRQDCADLIHRAKKEGNIPVRDEAQRKEVLKRAYETAEEIGTDPEMTEEIFEILIRMNEKRQTELEI